jgi:5'-nucleotidase (lipoprotein e(P4) family)
MNTKKYLLAFALVASSIVSTYFVTVSSVAQKATAEQMKQITADNEYQVAAILFMQKAAEYRALTYQAFNLARMQLDADFEKKNLKRLPKAERKRARAVVVDVDETVLDNSPHQAFIVTNRLPFSSDVWTRWVNRREAKAIPGAAEFLTYASGKGVKVFYVTNRDEIHRQGTIDNLKQTGFPDASEETVLVRAAGVSSKEARRQKILEKYRIVLLIGDNLNDLASQFEQKSVADRFAEVDKTRETFGRKFIVLPNAMYGDWESAIYNYGRGISDADKKKIRADALQNF